MMPLVEAVIGYARGLRLLAGKEVFMFGAYGWAGRAVLDMKEALTKCSAVVMEESLQWKF